MTSAPKAGRLVAGVDCSTQATKVVVVDADTATVVASGRSTHEVRSAGRASETDPNVWWDALRDALAQTGVARDIASLSVAGQQHGMVVLGTDMRPLRPAVLWNDTRSAEQATALVRSFGARWWAEEVGSVPVAAFTVTSWAWLRATEPEVAAMTRAVRLPHDWLTQRLCGEAVTDRGDASGTGWWSVPHGVYHRTVLDHELVEIPNSWLPEVLTPSAVAGTVTPAAADEVGLSPGVLVGPGTGDNMAAALGLALEPGVAVLSLGTSGTAYAVTGAPAADASGMVAGFADSTGRYLPLACTLNATLAVDRFAAWLGLDRDDIAPDSGGVTVLPFLDGERTPNLPGATGSIFGLTHATTRQQVLRAAYEGAVLSLLDALELIDGAGDGAAPLILIGGGARGAAWQEVAGRLSGRPLEIPAAAELVALGAAVQAAAMLGRQDLQAVARRFGGSTGVTRSPVARDDEALERARSVRAGL